ncbi:MAG: tyrosine-type recombinase/integrase [Methylococcaceae bacterium]
MLTDIEIRKAKPAEQPKKLSDSGGLFLLVTPQGSKLWRMSYRFNGKQKTLYIGAYPTVSLNDAREKREEAKKQLFNGIDPSTAKQAAKASQCEASANSFQVIALEWHITHIQMKSEGHAKKVMARFVNDIFPWIGKRPITEIEAPEILKLLRRIEQRGANQIAHDSKTVISQVFRYAIATGRASRNPVPDLQGALTPVVVTNRAAITDPKEIAALWRAVDGYTGTLATKCAFKLSFLVMLRPGEIRQAEWSEINLDTAEWRIPAAKMKMRDEHIVPLSRQAIEIFKEIHPLTGGGKYVFPSVRTNARPMSENTITGALRRLGYTGQEMTAHGFRSMVSTRLNESHLFNPDAIERQLAHGDHDKIRAAYNRSQYLPERVKMLQWWADYLDSLQQPNIVPFQAKA